MSACSCDYGTECDVFVERGPHTARKAGHVCFVCGGPVLPGDLCNDATWISEGVGGFCRAHEICWTLRMIFADEVCGGEFTVGPKWDIEEATAEAVARTAGSPDLTPEEAIVDAALWRAWLELVELTWLISSEKDQAPGTTCEDCIAFARCRRGKGPSREGRVTRLSRICGEFTPLQGRTV